MKDTCHIGFLHTLSRRGQNEKKERAVLNMIGGGTLEGGAVKVARSKVLRPNFLHTLSGRNNSKRGPFLGMMGGGVTKKEGCRKKVSCG
jgi:hypothetical protein